MSGAPSSLTINEEQEKVESLECKDCTASLGGCKHALAFLMWAHRRSEDPSPTNVTSYWVRPALSGVGTPLKFISASDFAKTNTQAAPGTSSFKEELVYVGIQNRLKGQILKYGAELDDKFEALSLYKLMCRFHALGGVGCEDFLSFAKGEVSEQICEEAEVLTQCQSDSLLWHEIRFERVTASELYEFAHCGQSDGTLVKSIIGAYKIRDTEHMQRGRALEKKVLQCVETTLHCKFTDYGIFLLPKFPIFGASPDAISSKYVIEVKYPSSDKHIENYIEGGEIKNKFKTQIHLQMMCAGKREGLFCVADPNFEKTKNVIIINVKYDEKYINVLLEKALDNWKNFVFPKLYSSVS